MLMSNYKVIAEGAAGRPEKPKTGRKYHDVRIGIGYRRGEYRAVVLEVKGVWAHNPEETWRKKVVANSHDWAVALDKAMDRGVEAGIDQGLADEAAAQARWEMAQEDEEALR